MFKSILAVLVIIAALAWKIFKKVNGEKDYTITEFKEEEVTVVTPYPAGVDKTVVTYYEMSDGTWKCNDRFYKCRLILSGKPPVPPNMTIVPEMIITVLSNDPNLTFEEAHRHVIGLPSSIGKDIERFVYVKSDINIPMPNKGANNK